MPATQKQNGLLVRWYRFNLVMSKKSPDSIFMFWMVNVMMGAACIGAAIMSGSIWPLVVAGVAGINAHHIYTTKC